MMTVVRCLSVVLVTLLALLLPGVSQAADPVMVKLNPQNNSGESGSATLTDVGGKTKVTVTVTGQPAGTPQPMHIHKGTCGQLEARPTYGLPALVDGKSEATVDVSLADLQKGAFAINGHKSAQEAAVYVYCGEIPKM
jgi:Cu/Zn superoxide dismutase